MSDAFLRVEGLAKKFPSSRGELAVFDVRPLQPEIHLHVVRFDAATPVQSMVKYIEISNVLRAVDIASRGCVRVSLGRASVHANRHFLHSESSPIAPRVVLVQQLTRPMPSRSTCLADADAAAHAARGA